MTTEAPAPIPAWQAIKWPLLVGNFFIGSGVMVVNGAMNDVMQSLRITAAQGGYLIAMGAVLMGLGAPILATLVGTMDRRRLLAATMLWYGAGHVLCALAPDYPTLCLARALTLLSAALFTPQAAAAMGSLAPAQHRGQAITFVFIGWAMATVIGIPLSTWVGETFGWRAAMGLVAAGAIASSVWIWRALPDGIRPAALNWRAWLQVLGSPVFVAVVLVSAFQSAGQMSVLAFAAPYFKQHLGGNTTQISLTFAYFGVLALVGNIALNQVIDRVGASLAVTVALALMALGMVLWPLAGSLAVLALVLMPWALSAFAANSGQQARLGALSPTLSPYLMALNTSAIYAGHALGAGGGGWWIDQMGGFEHLHGLGLAWVLAAVLLSAWVHRQTRESGDGVMSKVT